MIEKISLSPTINLNIYENLESASINLARLYKNKYLKLDKPFFVLPGGSTPKLFYKELVKNIKNWSDSTIILSDERFVSDDSEKSNYFHLKKLFFNRLGQDNKPNFISLKNYKDLESNNDQLNFPNITLLGLGSDSHTASLFPNNAKIIEPKKNIYMRIKNSNENFERISLTFDFLLKSEVIYFLISGKKKTEALSDCFNMPYDPIKRPAQFIFQNYSKSINIFCDEDASKRICS